MRWSYPTRGYVAAAAVTAAVVVLAGVGWQVWELAAGTVRDAGGLVWSVASMVLTVVAAAVMVDGARRPQSPRAKPPRFRGRRGWSRVQRRQVRRAVWRGELPADRELWRAAGAALAQRAGDWVMAPWWFLLAAFTVGLAASHAPNDRPWPTMGVAWVGLAVFQMLVVAWWRRNATRLDTAWRSARELAS